MQEANGRREFAMHCAINLFILHAARLLNTITVQETPIIITIITIISSVKLG